MMRSLYAGVSGLRNHQVRMDVIGNNIANVNTIGFKAGRVTFKEALSQTLAGASRPSGDLGGTNPMQVGLGMSIGSIDTLFVQGSLESTGQMTDLAIQGDGFFIVSDGKQRYYTRVGAFGFGADGRLVYTANGLAVQGRMADANGVIATGATIGDIVLPFGQKAPAKATTSVDFSGNLDASAKPKGTILSSDRLYGIELAGHDSELNGLYARGAANSIVSGLSSGLTTITVTDGGVVGTRTYTYVSTDTAVGDGLFNSLDDLIAEINTDFGATSFTAALNANGAIVMTDVSGASNPLVFRSNNSILNAALSAANGDVNASPMVTDQFFHVARATDLLINLCNSDGTNLGLTVNDEITINAKVGGTSVSPGTLAVTGTTTYEDFITQIQITLGITNSPGVTINAQNGALVINGDGGKANEITDLNIMADDTSGPGGASRVEFNAVFDSTPGNWIESQKAADVVHEAAVVVYDSLGATHIVTVTFTKDVILPNRWRWEATVPFPATVSSGNTGWITFNNDGSLSGLTYDGGATSFQFDPRNGANNPVEIFFNVGTFGGMDGITQFSSPFTVVAHNQNGYTMGDLDKIVINQTGEITGLFTNGTTKTLAQIVLATFNNPGGLLRVRDTMYLETSNTGLPILGTAGTEIRGSITPGALEMSNVDLTQEFTNMIIAQRGFQANARVISISDDMLSELVNLKR